MIRMERLPRCRDAVPVAAGTLAAKRLTLDFRDERLEWRFWSHGSTGPLHTALILEKWRQLILDVHALSYSVLALDEPVYTTPNQRQLVCCFVCSRACGMLRARWHSSSSSSDETHKLGNDISLTQSGPTSAEMRASLLLAPYPMRASF
jgi:hypothetical protein